MSTDYLHMSNLAECWTLLRSITYSLNRDWDYYKAQEVLGRSGLNRLMQQEVDKRGYELK